MLEKLPQMLGEALQSQRAGAEGTVYHRVIAASDLLRLDVHSSAFTPGGPLPKKYTADGAGLSPPLEWQGLAAGSVSAVLIVEDADSPTPHPLVHAIVVNLDPGNGWLSEGALSSPEHEGAGLQTGRNSYLRQSWLPPDPPPGHGVHRYFFQVFALREGAAFSEVPGRQELFEAVFGRAVAAGCVIGTYERAVREPTENFTEEASVPYDAVSPA